MDRLSSLPDELLILILGFLPTKDAAITSMVCRKLRCVFPLITSLDLNVSPWTISHCVEHPNAIERYPTFIAFVEAVLRAHRFNKYLTRFRLKVGSEDFASFYYPGCYHGIENCCFPHLKYTHFSDWIAFPLSRRGLTELDLCILVRYPGLAHLPPAIFTACPMLKVLKLEVNLGLDVVIAVSSYYRLPNLKHLVLSVFSISNFGFLPSLLSSCPLLEDLTFQVHAMPKHVPHITIRSTSLRKLYLSFHTGGTTEQENCDLVLIHTPNLEYLKYVDNLACSYSIPTMHSLIRADIVMRGLLFHGPLEVSFQQLLNIIKPLAYAQQLHFGYEFMRVFDIGDVDVLKEQLPMFPNLKLLELGCSGYNYFWNECLLVLFNHSPVLETLVFYEGVTEWRNNGYNSDSDERELRELERELFRTAHPVPSCCRYHLKRIVIKIVFGVERELEMIQFLLRHALVLEELVIFRHEYTDCPIPDQISLENTLRNLPRASITCSIQVV